MKETNALENNLNTEINKLKNRISILIYFMKKKKKPKKTTTKVRKYKKKENGRHSNTF